MDDKPTIRTALIFIFFTFMITWAINIPLALAAHHQIKFSVPRWVEITSTLSPGIVALSIIICRCKEAGLKTLLTKILKWRVNYRWYLFALLIPVVCVVPSLCIYLYILHKPLDLSEWYLPLILFFIFIPFSPLWEEIGWRGFLLPILQDKFRPLTAAVILGLIWGIWHIPMYLTHNPEGSRTQLFLVYFIIGTVPITILFVWLYNKTESLLITIFFHAAINATFALFGKVPTGELRPFIYTMIFFTIAATGISWKTKAFLGQAKTRYKAPICNVPPG
ncbi:CPBP family intramembrane glutamic endopeptidase [Mucilaginibacter flavidus]|uniref:CPBP family intramembrane glutamic endopeptidase n=1 Tax=Mucilaginibacter flavidus TaxID=2949309 RepID=UPI0020921437|nr:type II CAAX endopeptidase family protein [Mucilaginibacter flavidus]MCO5945685.1 CPBP family intramembrane metalloprotease [Mucilaginibacter flavidus]